jgi:type VI protein secretion system component VasK
MTDDYQNTSTWHLYMIQSNRKRKRSNPLKHKLTVVLSVLIIVAVAAVCVVRYEHHRNWQDAQALKAKVSAYVQQQEKASQAAAQQRQLNGLKAQCAKDHATYAAETPAQRATSKVTDCNPSLQLVQ